MWSTWARVRLCNPTVDEGATNCPLSVDEHLAAGYTFRRPLHHVPTRSIQQTTTHTQEYTSETLVGGGRNILHRAMHNVLIPSVRIQTSVCLLSSLSHNISLQRQVEVLHSTYVTTVTGRISGTNRG